MWNIAEQLDRLTPTAIVGQVAHSVGLTVAAAGFPAPIGALAEIERADGPPLRAEVIGFRDDLTLLYPLSDLMGVRRGQKVRLKQSSRWLRVGPALLGRVIDPMGRTVDGGPQPMLADRVPLDRRPPHACERPRINQVIGTGIRAIDGLLTCGQGQRMGIFAGSGVGKSVLLGMMARNTSADVNVIALIGERGRELNEFIERDLGREGLARSVVVVATSDEPALLRVQAAWAATAAAEYFRDQGKNVLLMMDSLTRFALAQREIGLAAGEPPATRGFPPSVFALLPRLVERAGRGPKGSITAFYSVLVEADDPNEPIADCVRGLLDGHIWLSRKLGARGHYPAIDVLESLSRLMNDIVSPEQKAAALAMRELLAAYRDHEDLISIGAYRRGANPVVDVAIDQLPEIQRFLRQPSDDHSTLEETRDRLIRWHQARRSGETASALGAAPGSSAAQTRSEMPQRR